MVKALTGQTFDVDEQPTAGIDCHRNYEIQVGSGKPWIELGNTQGDLSTSKENMEDAELDKSKLCFLKFLR